MGRLVIDGGDVYELDESCLKEKRQESRNRSVAAASSGRNAREGGNSGHPPAGTAHGNYPAAPQSLLAD